MLCVKKRGGGDKNSNIDCNYLNIVWEEMNVEIGVLVEECDPSQPFPYVSGAFLNMHAQPLLRQPYTLQLERPAARTSKSTGLMPHACNVRLTWFAYVAWLPLVPLPVASRP